MRTVVRITSGPSAGWSTIRVQWTHSESLYKYIRAIGALGLTLPVDGATDEICVPALASGELKVVVEEAADFRTFEVQAHPKALAPVLMDWVNGLKQA